MIANSYRCEVFYRTDTIGQFHVQQQVFDRIRALEEQDMFDRTDLNPTWHGIGVREEEDEDDIVATYNEFRDWARANDFDLKPAFDTRPRYVAGSLDIRDTVCFPVVALAIYSTDELQAVVPCSDEFGHYTVQEALEGFERGDIDRWVSRFTGISIDRTTPRPDEAVAL